jgi:CheY-like chemotaxis protein
MTPKCSQHAPSFSRCTACACPIIPSVSERKRILVVDDDARLAASLRRALAYEGYAVEVATDVMMPGPDGVEVCRRLREGSDGARISKRISRGLEEALRQGAHVTDQERKGEHRD